MPVQSIHIVIRTNQPPAKNDKEYVRYRKNERKRCTTIDNNQWLRKSKHKPSH